jgi:biopolymer transport protein ExbB
MKLSFVLPATILCAAALVLPVAEAAAQSPTTARPAPAVQKKTLFESIYEGGWVMVPIALCSVLTVYLVGDGVMRTGSAKLAPPNQIEAIKKLFRPGDYVGAYNYCKANPSPLTNVLRVGISYLGDGQNMAETAMSEELATENSRLQTKLSYLSVIGVCTPMIGLLGTVTGMMSAFSTLGTSGIGDPSSLAGAIGEVLIATASGLFIAIPAFAFFYYLRNRAAGAIHIIEETVNSLFRKMPYDMLRGVHIGDEELFAGVPNWMVAEPVSVAESQPTQVYAPAEEPQTVTAQAPV